MRYKIYTYIHLVILILYIFRPVLPYIEYAVNKEYIAKYLCVNRDKPHSCCAGKCYLEKQIRKSMDPNDSKDNNTNKKIQNEEVKEFLITNVTNPELFETYLTHLINPQTPVTVSYVSTIFIPPKIKFII